MMASRQGRRAELARRWNLPAHHLDDGLIVGIGGEQFLSRQRRPHDGPDGKQVRPRVARLSTELLRSHVGGLSHGDLIGFDCLSLGCKPSAAEVGQASRAVHPDEDVLRRDVSMHQAQVPALFVGNVMHVLQPAQNVQENGDDDGRGRPPVIGQQFGKIGPLDVVEDEKRLILVVAHVHQRLNVGVVEERADPRLAHERPDGHVLFGSSARGRP